MKMDGKRLTAFQRKVYSALMAVPRGRVVTYAELGRAIGCRSPRAIGQALRINPFAPRVPCHRVVAAGGWIGGFEGQTGGAALAKKRRLLARESVVFVNGRLEDPGRLYRFR